MSETEPQKLMCQHQFYWQELWAVVLLNDKSDTGLETVQMCVHFCTILIFSHLVLKYVTFGKENLDVCLK